MKCKIAKSIYKKNKLATAKKSRKVREEPVQLSSATIDRQSLLPEPNSQPLFLGTETADIMDMPPICDDGYEDEEEEEEELRLEDDDQLLRLFKGGFGNPETCMTLQQALEELRLSKEDHVIPSSKIGLKDHQIYGVAWMLRQEQVRVCQGGNVADEVGLGKTFMMFALALYSKNRWEEAPPPVNRHIEPTPRPVTLIVVPNVTLARQTLAELVKYFTGIPRQSKNGKRKRGDRQADKRVDGLYDENLALSAMIYKGETTQDHQLKTRQVDIVIATYNTIFLESALEKIQADRSNMFALGEGRERGPVFDFEFDRIILDEAHAIRNGKGGTCAAVQLLKGEKRWCFTATPIFNHPRDFSSYLRFQGVMFPSEYQRLVLNQFDSFHRHRRVLARTRFQLLARHFTLRRTKQSTIDGKRVSDVPPYILHKHELEATEVQQEVYDNIFHSMRSRWQAKSDNEGSAGEVKMVMSVWQTLRQCCDHPCLPDLISGADDIDSRDPITYAEESAKIKKIGSLLKADKGRKTLIFCEFLKTVPILVNYLKALKITCVNMSGTASLSERECAVNSFKDDSTNSPTVLILTRGGSVGLNLTIATRVIILSPTWTWSATSQIIGRAHREGQKQIVDVHILLLKETYEDRMDSVRSTKKAYADMATGELDQEDACSNLTFKAIRQLLDPGFFGQDQSKAIKLIKL